MRGFLTLSLAALASAAVPSTALAGSMSPEEIAEKREARQALDTLGRCIVQVREETVRRFLRNPSDGSWHPVMDYDNDEAPCYGMYSVTTAQPAMRGAVAEAWYLAKYAGGAPASLTVAVAPSQEEVAARIVAADEADRPQVIVDEFARCVAATAPKGVDALLRTPVGSSAESKAVGALSASFGPCAFEGQKLAFDAEMLRAALAFALASRVVSEGAA